MKITDRADSDRHATRRPRGRWFRSPAIAILLLAPFFGEALSGSTPPLDLVQPWNLAFTAALYGAGALVCREVARRYGLGLGGLCLLGAAYGVYEEGIADRYWYYPTFWDDTGVGTYSVVWDTNLLLAVHLTVFHAAISISASVLVVERLFPDHRERPWVGRRGLTLAALSLFVVVPFLYGEVAPWPSTWLIAASATLCVVLIVAAFLVPRRLRRPSAPQPRSPGRRVGLIAFAATTAHFLSVYLLPSTGLPWPVSIAITLVPIALGAVVIRRRATGGPYGYDALRVIAGMVAFFVVLDALVGLAGRYDMTVGAIATALALRWFLRRERPRGEEPSSGGSNRGIRGARTSASRR